MAGKQISLNRRGESRGREGGLREGSGPPGHQGSSPAAALCSAGRKYPGIVNVLSASVCAEDRRGDKVTFQAVTGNVSPTAR